MRKKALTIAIAGALAAPGAADAVSFNISGQVNRAIMFADDGEASDVGFVDSTASNTRFRITGSEDIGNGITAGIRLEFSASTNSNYQFTIKQPGDTQLVSPPTNGSGFNRAILGRRINELWFSSNWGKLSLGAGSGAGDGSAEADLSNTWLADESVWTTWAGSITFRTDGGAQSGIPVFSAHTNFDGASRYNRVRYDSPAFGPFTFKASVGQNELWEVGGHLSASLAGGDLSANAAFTHGDNRRGGDTITGSASYLFAQGTNITVSIGNFDFANGQDDGRNYYIKLGHRWGNNAVSASYGLTEDKAFEGSRLEHWAVGFVHTIPKPSVELYAGWHNNDLDDGGDLAEAVGLARNTDFDDINTVFVGSRIKFD